MDDRSPSAERCPGADRQSTFPRERMTAMPYDPKNIFAKILRGELPCVKLYEDALTLAFLDIMPSVEGHALIITKEPAEGILDLSPDGAAALIQTTQKIARAVKTALSPDGAAAL